MYFTPIGSPTLGKCIVDIELEKIADLQRFQSTHLALISKGARSSVKSAKVLTTLREESGSEFPQLQVIKVSLRVYSDSASI